MSLLGGDCIFHVDGRLINVEDASHVICTLQAFLHCSPFVYMLRTEDTDNHHCTADARCMECAFRKLLKDLVLTGVSELMSKENQLNPFQVLTIFIDILRMEMVARKPGFTDVHLRNSPISKIWQIETKLQVLCTLCEGCYIEKRYCNGIELLGENVSDLEDSINTYLSLRRETCSHCLKNQAQCNVIKVCLPKCMIIVVERCSPEFLLPMCIKIEEDSFTFNSVIVKPNSGKDPCFVITSCPNNYFRRFDDTKVSLVSPVSLSNAEFLYSSQLTLLFLKQNRQLQVSHSEKFCTSQQTQSNITHGKTSDGTKIVSYPKLSLLSHTNDDPSTADKTTPHIPVKSPRKRTVSTQTYHLVHHVEIQTLPNYSYENCKHNPKFKFFTGLEVKDFGALFELIGGDEVISKLKQKYAVHSPVKQTHSRLTSEDKLFMFLLRLRRGLPLEELAEMFRVSVSTVSNLCYVMTRLIYLTFKSMEDDMFPSAAQQHDGKPPQMRPFKNLRIILDGASFFMETPSNFQQQGNMYSNYKNHSVMVFSIGISCRGATIYCSGGMEGSMSDKAVIVKSGLLDRLQKGDGVMTDRGYELTAELQEKGCMFYKPPTLGNRSCFTPEEEILTKAIASARIYSEHAIADIKDNRLLKGTIPLLLLPVLGNLVYIAAYLRNFNEIRVKNKKSRSDENETMF
ncbi:polyprotein [Frankliniella fusca]|uniref:Polyprotein n=1 Tax=Frankliniella fusca TaxID=407009 RepID=A0AAE1H8P6_9NEOP|nr:polyprotein [Frankliniella fusca]